MRTIWKFEFDLQDILQSKGKFVRQLPKIEKFLTAAAQGDNLCCWALLDDSAELLEYTFEIIGTGHQIKDRPEDLINYIGTGHFEKRKLVLHLFVGKVFAH